MDKTQHQQLVNGLREIRQAVEKLTAATTDLWRMEAQSQPETPAAMLNAREEAVRVREEAIAAWVQNQANTAPGPMEREIAQRTGAPWFYAGRQMVPHCPGCECGPGLLRDHA